MQSNARLVHYKQRVHERRAEAGRQIHALHFAAAQRARGTIKREITDADFAKIIQPRTNFVAQHVRGRVVRRDADLGENVARVRNRKRIEIREGQGFPALNDLIIQGFGLEPSAVAFRACRVSAIAAEQHAHVHFVSLALSPTEKSANPVPTVVAFVIIFDAVAALLAFDHKILIGFRQFLKRNIDVDVFPRAGAQQIFL